MNTFDSLAASWDDDPTKVDRAALIAESIGGVVDLRRVESLADVGSGTGLLGFALIERAASRIRRGVFIDPSEGMRAEVEARLKTLRIEKSFKTADIDVSQVDLGNLGARDGALGTLVGNFDLVVSMLALHHIENVDLALENMSRMLVAGGKLAIVDILAGSRDFHDSDSPEHFHKGFDPAELSRRLEQHGMSHVATKEPWEKHGTVFFLLVAEKA